MTVVVDIAELIKTSRTLLRDSEQRVADVILKDQSFAISATTTELSRRANVSATSVTRFCRALGFSGLREFKICLAQNLAVNTHFMANAVRRNDSFSELAHSITDALSAALQEINSELPIDAFSQALDILADARHVCVFPVDQVSQGIALDAQIRLLRLGFQASIHPSEEEQRMVVAAARDRTALLIIAADAATPEFADLLDLLADDKRPSVVIAPQSAHARRVASVLLSFRAPAHSEIFSQTALRYKQAIVVDLLCTGHALNLSDRADERRRPVMPNPAPPMKGQPMSGAE